MPFNDFNITIPEIPINSLPLDSLLNPHAMPCCNSNLLLSLTSMEALSRFILNPTLHSHVLHKTTRNAIVCRTQFPAHLLCLNRTPNSKPNPFKSHFSLSSISFSSTQFGINPIISNDVVLSRERSFGTVNNLSDGSSVLGRKDYLGTVVLLGWLGAKEKHLRRYAEWYNSRGFRAITFVVEMKELLCFDLGRGVEDRITALANEVGNWVSENEEDGRQRVLLFHTFSNTGWLVYISIIERLLDRDDVMEKIKGCVIDSGGAEPLNPKVWAAGFCAALLKRRSSATYPANENQNSEEFGSQFSPSKSQENDTSAIETTLLLALGKLFTFLLSLPDVQRRLKKVISILSDRQPLCPQLYLYSTADKVIPFESVESFMEAQRKTGRKVFSYNFMSSPHVDHYRNFPNIYLSELENFWRGCLAEVKQVK